MGWKKVLNKDFVTFWGSKCASPLWKFIKQHYGKNLCLKMKKGIVLICPHFHFSRKIIGCTFLKSGRGLYAWAFPPLILHHRCALQISLSWIDVSLEFLGSSSTLKPRNNEPWYSEFRDIVNKTQLLFWGCTKHITFDIVNYPI